MRRNNYIPERLNLLIEERQLSLKELSEKTEIPIPTLRAYVHGKREAISTRNMLLFAQVFEIPMAELVDYLCGIDNIDKK